MKNKDSGSLKKNERREFIIVILILIFCGLFSRFVLKEWVSIDSYKVASFGFLALGFLVFYPLLTRLFIKKGK